MKYKFKDYRLPLYFIKYHCMRSPNLTDESLFILTQHKDSEAFTLIYDKYHRILYALALQYLKEKMFAEDIVQQVFLDLWESAPRITVPDNLRNYLYTSTKNLILKKIKTENKEIALAHEMSALQKVIQDTPEEKRKAEQKLKSLYAAIECLPEQERRICKLKIEENLSNEQIAEQLDVSVKTIQNHYTNLLKFLKRYLKKNMAYLITTGVIIIITGG